MTLQQLQERRNELAVKIKEFAKRHADQGGKWKDDEERQNWEKLNADYDAVIAQMDAARAAAEVSARAARVQEQQDASQRGAPPRTDFSPPAPTPDTRHAGTVDEETRALALAGFCRAQFGRQLDNEHVQAMQRCNIHPWQRELILDLGDSRNVRQIQASYRSAHHSRSREEAERRAAMSAFTYATGGALVPSSFMTQLEINMLAWGGLLQVADTLNTQSGEEMSWPTADDTSNEGEQVGENANIDNSNAGGPLPSFGAVKWNAYTFSSKAILVPYYLFEDSFTELPSILGSFMGERLGRTINRKCTLGSGANEPKGIVTASTLGVTAASATAIDFDEVIQLEHSVDPAYRTGAGYMCHDAVVLALRLLKDGNGQYLWQSGVANNRPDTLNGSPLAINQSMANSVAADAKTLLYGQLSRYKIRRVRQVRVYRLEERYRDKDQDGFIALLRADGNLLTAGTAPVKHLVQASS